MRHEHADQPDDETTEVDEQEHPSEECPPDPGDVSLRVDHANPGDHLSNAGARDALQNDRVEEHNAQPQHDAEDVAAALPGVDARAHLKTPARESTNVTETAARVVGRA